MPAAHRDACPRHGVAVAGTNRERRLEDGRVRLLLHEQRDVLEGVVEVHAEAATHNVVAFTREVISEADARAEAFTVIGRLLGYQGSTPGAERCASLQLL